MTHTEYMRKWRRFRLAEGLCAECGKEKRDAWRILGPVCAAKQQERDKRRKAS